MVDLKALVEAQIWDTVFGKDLETLNPTKGSVNVLYGNGRYVRRTNPIGTFFGCVDRVLIPGLPQGPEPSFSFGLPKIPKEILAQQISFYRGIMDEMKEAEAASLVFYDLKEKRYFIHVKISDGKNVRQYYAPTGIVIDN